MPRARRKTSQSALAPVWSIPSLRAPRYSQSLERGLAILGCFTAQRPVLGIAEMADELGMSRSSTHRYAITLLALGYLEQDKDRKYRLGLRVTALGMSALNATGLGEHAHPILEELCRQTGLSTSVAVLDGSEVVYVDRVRGWRPGQNRLDRGLGAGSRLPGDCTALGKILLAHIPERERRKLLSHTPLKRTGPNTIMSESQLRTELEQAREEGFAIENQEYASELIAIAAPVRNATGEIVAAIDISTDTLMMRVEELANALRPHLLVAADRVSARLGYRRGNER